MNGPVERAVEADEHYEAVLAQIEIDEQLADEARDDPSNWETDDAQNH